MEEGGQDDAGPSLSQGEAATANALAYPLAVSGCGVATRDGLSRLETVLEVVNHDAEDVEAEVFGCWRIVVGDGSSRLVGMRAAVKPSGWGRINTAPSLVPMR